MYYLTFSISYASMSLALTLASSLGSLGADITIINSI